MNYNKRKKMKIERIEEGTNECTHYERKEEKREEGKKEREERIPRGRKRNREREEPGRAHLQTTPLPFFIIKSAV